MIRKTLRTAYLADEQALVRNLIAELNLSQAERTAICARAATLVDDVRATGEIGIMESFLSEYGLSTDEGVALMCLAEAMLRVPDSFTIDDLIRDKITPHNWASHIGDSGSILVNASTWGLMLTGKVLQDDGAGISGTLQGMLRRIGEPVIRTAVARAMAEMGSQFVLGRTIDEAMKRADKMVEKGFTYSYDMLGEAACTNGDALRYLDAYQAALASIASRAVHDDIRKNPGISVKLSALHPRYERAQEATMVPILAGRLLILAQAAAAANIGLTIDAEEADRLDISLDVIERVLSDDSLAGWDGFGVVVQAFGRRAMPVLDWLADMAERLDRHIMVRLVKGAYWDQEIKRAQVMGLGGYPVFTRKSHTDVSYMACARKLLTMTNRVYPQFATHNAHSIAAILAMAPDKSTYEFQRLHGMGEILHTTVLASEQTNCRIYAPVGAHKDLLAYLVRRLLENGANSSFVNQIVDETVSSAEIARDPIAEALETGCTPNPSIPLPMNIFAPRRNSMGFDLTDPVTLERINVGRDAFAAPYQWTSQPITPADFTTNRPEPRYNPAVPTESIGTAVQADVSVVTNAVDRAVDAQQSWADIPTDKRAEILRKVADIYEENAFEIFALATREAGKILLDGVAELREAVDFLRYYADATLRSNTGTFARGVMVCISPWNFPLAIFTGQIAAALGAGNAVIAKPAEQSPMIATRAVQWMHKAGVPAGVIQLLPGEGATVGAALTADPRIAGVCFTGSTEVAKLIERQLAKTAPRAILIAETGGLNAMIVDSTALVEQATRDIVRAAFQSAGQRCSALRVLYVQKEIADDVIEMVSGAMDELVTDTPWNIATDVGPVIDREARDDISAYVENMRDQGRLIKQTDVPNAGCFVAPTMVRIDGIHEVKREVFGPVLHVATFDAEDIDATVDAINATGFGLTFGIHTRIDRRVQQVLDRINVGNAYVNRDQIGAVVGSQPFGGHGLSGTGPKAGGAHYLPRFRAAANAPVGNFSFAEDGGVLSDGLALPDGSIWADARNRVSQLRGALRGKSADVMAETARLDYGPIDLPGPTGEGNQTQLTPRGTVLCLGPTSDGLMSQVIQALAAGNRVIAVAPNAVRVLGVFEETEMPLLTIDGRITAADLGVLEIDLVAVACDDVMLGQIRSVLAARQGPIIGIVTEAIAPVQYCHERAICIDTTAAGGNATLLAESG